MDQSLILAIVVAAALLVWAGAVQIALVRSRAAMAEADQRNAEQLARYSSIVDAEAEASRIRVDAEAAGKATRDQADAEASAVARSTTEVHHELAKLRASYSEKKQLYDRLAAEVAIFDDRLAFAEMGVYEPHFDYGDSDAYKAAVAAVRDRQKQLVTDKAAVVCTTNWQVDGSRAKGQTMTNRGIRLTLRAFNGECDAAIANTRWNNVLAMEKRVVRSFEQIEKLNASNAIHIDPRYLELKLTELRLTHEQREKTKAEKDERAEAARLVREEQRLLRDLEDAEEQEAHYTRLLEKAKVEAEKIVGPKLDAFNEQIKVLEKDLADAHAKAERAKALAEQTRSGYVYIISNVGSFGEGVVKIGLTRRLDPLDRVRELGDASVPFTFDTHAIIYSDDAPALERALQNHFDAVRINAQNYRKEFFRVPIVEVEAAVAKLAPDAPFFRDVEAQEYRETLARRKAALASPVASTDAFPVSI